MDRTKHKEIKLTKKQRKFVNAYADKSNGVQAALASYDTTDYHTAGSIANENLKKPEIIEALKELGFDSNNAKRVVAKILNDDSVDEQHRLNAADKIFKVNGDYAPEKHVNVNINGELSEREQELAARLLQRQRN